MQLFAQMPYLRQDVKYKKKTARRKKNMTDITIVLREIRTRCIWFPFVPTTS